MSYVADSDVWLIEPRQYGVLDRGREFWEYRRLVWYFASDALTSLYRGSALGWLWLLMRVLGPIGITGAVFGGVLGAPSDDVPYFLFLVCGMTTWLLFERSLIFVTRSLERNRRIIRKVYFPRMILPVAFVAPAVFYLIIVLLILAGTVIYYYRQDGVWYVTMHPRLLAAAGAIVLSLVFAVAVGLWTSVLQLRYRDVRYGLRYFMPFWLYVTPVFYPLSLLLSKVPEKYHWLISINPMVTIVEAFKWGTLGRGSLQPASIAASLTLILVTIVVGMWFFNRYEAASVDKL